MITFPRRVPHKRSVPGGDDPDDNITLVLFEEGSIATWHTAAQAETVRKSDHSRKTHLRVHMHRAPLPNSRKELSPLAEKRPFGCVDQNQLKNHRQVEEVVGEDGKSCNHVEKRVFEKMKSTTGAHQTAIGEPKDPLEERHRDEGVERAKVEKSREIEGRNGHIAMHKGKPRIQRVVEVGAKG